MSSSSLVVFFDQSVIGGFAKFELDLISANQNTDAVNLGPLTLRAETAALAAIACWQAVLGNWRSK